MGGFRSSNLGGIVIVAVRQTSSCAPVSLLWALHWKRAGEGSGKLFAPDAAQGEYAVRERE